MYRWDREMATYVFKNASKASATLSPTASFTMGTSPFSCCCCSALGLRLLLELVSVASSRASFPSSPKLSASVVVRRVACRVEDCALGDSEFCGALLGGRDERGSGGEDICAGFIETLMRIAPRRVVACNAKVPALHQIM